jgi:hypothetical protein
MKKSITLAAVCLAITTTSFINMRPPEREKQNKETITRPARVMAEEELRTYKTKLGNDKNKQVQLEVYRSTVQVVGHNSDEVVIETRSYHLPERAAGLRSLFSQVEDNTNLGLAVLKENNTLRIVQATRRGGRYTIKVPKNVAVVYHEENTPFGGKFSLSGTEGEIDVKLHHGSATLTNITGPLKANSIHGRLDITFSHLNQAKASTINSVHGPVDITLPANTKADFELSANHGEIYTDFDLNRDRDQKDGLTKIAGGHTIMGKTNNGGVAMNVSAIHSDIFIRKQK